MIAVERLAALIRLDATIAARHKLVHVTVIVAIVFGALIGFVAPANLDLGGTDTIFDQSEGEDLALVDAPEPRVAPTVLDPGAEKPAFNELLLPVIYTLDLCILGFMFGSVMVLQDKQQGTIQFYAVGPGTSAEYMISKLAVNLGLSLLNIVILTGLAAPWALAKPGLYLLTILICGGMTLAGMALSVYLRSMAQWFFPVAAVSLVTATPTYLMFAPSEALAWTFWVPTYHMLFGAEALMFGGDGAVFTTAVLFGLGFFALMAALCLAAIHGRLLREAH